MMMYGFVMNHMVMGYMAVMDHPLVGGMMGGTMLGHRNTGHG